MHILDALDASGMADDTVVVFTSDHGDLLGAHGGLLQKWHNAYDEATRVPFLVSGPMVDRGAARNGGVHIATSHVDVIPTCSASWVSTWKPPPWKWRARTSRPSRCLAAISAACSRRPRRKPRSTRRSTS